MNLGKRNLGWLSGMENEWIGTEALHNLMSMLDNMLTIIPVSPMADAFDAHFSLPVFTLVGVQKTCIANHP